MLPTPGVYDVEMTASAISVWHLTTPANSVDPASTVTRGARTRRDAALVTAGSAASVVSQTTPVHTGRLRVIPLDTFHLLSEIVADYGTYGFTNASMPACGATASLG